MTIINPNDDVPIPEEVMKAMRAEAAKNMTIAAGHAAKFASKIKQAFPKEDMSTVLTILASVTCDLLAEAMVLLDHNGLHSLEKSIPMFTGRLSHMISIKQEEIGGITIAKRFPPSAN